MFAVWDASQDHLKLYDNTKLVIGTGVHESAFDASLYHDGTDLNLTNTTGEFKISTDTVRITAGTAGDANLILQADTDNNDEADNPFMLFEQDGGAIRSIIGHTGADSQWPDATTLTGGKNNNLVIGTTGSAGAARGMQFATLNNVRMTISSSGLVQWTPSTASDIKTHSNINITVTTETGYILRYASLTPCSFCNASFISIILPSSGCFIAPPTWTQSNLSNVPTTTSFETVPTPECILKSSESKSIFFFAITYFLLNYKLLPLIVRASFVSINSLNLLSSKNK